MFSPDEKAVVNVMIEGACGQIVWSREELIETISQFFNAPILNLLHRPQSLLSRSGSPSGWH